MENFSEFSKKTPIEKIHHIISDAKKDVAKEFANTGNAWCACFKSDVEGVDIYLGIVEMTSAVSPENLKTYQRRLESLKAEICDLADKYPNKAQSPDPETQANLFKKLNIFEEYKKEK